ncbi:MAG: S-layer family protein, partial [Gammaproteobacteria bacterium]|nr:S-layer family protein [Gammaproteobacteria bacterium]
DPDGAGPLLPIAVAANGTVTGDIQLKGSTTTNGGNFTATTTAGYFDNNYTGGAISTGTGNVTINTGGDGSNHGAWLGDISTSTGELSITTTGGGIFQTNSDYDLVIGGTATLNSGADDITLNSSGNNFAIVGVTATNVSLSDTNTVALTTSTVSGTLDITSGRDIAQIGVLTVAGNASFEVANNRSIVLGNTSNSFGGDISLSARTSSNFSEISIANSGAIELGELNVAGNLSILAAGDITDAGDWDVAGVTGLDAGTGSITLDTVDLNEVVIRNAGTVTIEDSNGLNIGSSDTSSSFANTDSNIVGALSITSGSGAITDLDSTALVVGGLATIDSGAGDIILDSPSNNFANADLTGSNITLVDTNGVILDSVTASGNLHVSVTGVGAITQTGALAATHASFELNAGQSLDISNTGNNFTGTVSVSANTAGDLVDVAISNNSALDLGAISTSRHLSIVANGAVTDSGDLNVGGVAGIDANGNSITLDSANDFNALVLVDASSATINEANDLIIGSTDTTSAFGETYSNVTNDLNITSTGGNLTDENTTGLTVGGVSTIDMGAGNITLDSSLNNFSSASVTGNNVTIIDPDGIELGTSAIGGRLDVEVTSTGNITQNGALDVTGDASFTVNGGQSITLAETTNNFQGSLSFASNTLDDLLSVNIANNAALDLGNIAVSQDLSVTANGAITNSGALRVTGATTLSATGNDITLDNAGNDFNSVALSGANVSIQDANAIEFAASTITGGFTVDTNGGGNITQSGALSVAGATTLSATGNDITLDNAGNDFTSVNIIDAQNVTLTDTDDIALQSTRIAGDLIVTADGAVTNSGALKVAGATTLTAAGYDITLNDSSNDFNNVALTGANVSIQDTNAIEFAASTITGGFTVDTNGGGNITQSGALRVTGTTTLTAAGYDITLGNADNNFNSVNIIDAQNVTLTDTNDIALQSTSIDGGLTVTAGGDIINFGALRVTGATTLTATGNDITLDNANNDFTSVALTGANVSIQDTNAIEFAASTITGGFTVDTNGGGNITQSGALRVAGTTTLTATGNDIILDNANNDFTSVALNGANVSIHDTNAIEFAASTITGGFTVDTNGGGNITQSGALSVAGTTTLTASGQNITLDQANNLNQVTIVSASNAVLNNGGNDLLLNSLTVGNTLELNAGAIIDGNGLANNVDANHLVMTSANGIGSSGALEIAVNTLDASNTNSGEIHLSQTGNIDLLALQNLGSNGNITFFNSDGDINFSPDSTVASLASTNGNLIMTTLTGSFLGLGTDDITHPDITAQNATFIGVAGTFGTHDRYLTLNVSGDVVINTRGAFEPEFVAPGPASLDSTGFNFTAAGAISAIAGEQLIEVESLSEVDPAIFTALRNYSHEETAIRMPRDQLYEDILEDGEEEQ